MVYGYITFGMRSLLRNIYSAYIITFLLTSRVAPHIFSQERAEGFFRFAHARIRTYVESIAFFNGEQDEQQNVLRTFKNVLRRTVTVLRKSFFLNCMSLIFCHVMNVRVHCRSASCHESNRSFSYWISSFFYVLE